MVATHGGALVYPVAPIWSNVAVSRLMFPPDRMPPVVRRPTACKGRSDGSWCNGDESHRKCQYLCGVAQHRHSPRHEFMLASALANAAVASSVTLPTDAHGTVMERDALPAVQRDSRLHCISEGADLRLVQRASCFMLVLY